jgi:hypothetical protein
VKDWPNGTAFLSLERDCVSAGSEFTELKEPDRVALVLSFIVSKFVFRLRGSNRYTAQSADRIVFAIRVQSVRKIRPELMNHVAPLPERDLR